MWHPNENYQVHREALLSVNLKKMSPDRNNWVKLLKLCESLYLFHTLHKKLIQLR